MYKKYIITLLLGLVFNHTYSQVDTQAPQLISINIFPDTINTKNSSASFTIKVIAKDNISGVKNGGVWYKSPSGLVNQSASLSFKGLLQDTATVVITLPQYSEAGIWKVSSMYFYDNANNYINLSSPFSSFGKDTLVVLSITDNTPPELVSLNISPDTINTSKSSASFIIKVVAKDNISGVKNAGVWYKSPSGLVNQSVSLTFNGKLEDTATATISLPQYSESGKWNISSIYFYDNANNYINLSSPFSSFGKDSVVVISITDNKPPELVSLNISPDTINTKNYSASFTIKVIAKDNISGVKNGGVWYKSPSGLVNQSASLSFKGSLQDTAIVVVTLPQYSEAGIWKVSNMYFNDNANNYINLSSPFSSFGKDSVIINYDSEIKNGAAFLIKDAYNIKSRSADVLSIMSITGNSNSYHDIRWQYQKGDLIGVNPEEQNLVTVDGAATLSNVNGVGNLINLSPGTKYSFRLVSKNKNGNIQDFSDTKQFITLGNTPPEIYDTIFSIKDSVSVNGKVGKIRSNDVDGDVLSFRIYSGNTNETFKIDSLGNIFVKNKIEYDKSNKFDLLISVNDGIDSITAKATINIAPIPTFNYSGVFGACTGDSLKVYTNKYAGYNIVWYKNGQVLNSQNIDTIYIKEATNYQIKIIKVADTIASVIKTFIINTIPSSPAASAKNLCQNEAGISLSATATSGNSLIWYGTNATGGSSSTTAPIISTASTGNVDYYVSQKNTTTGCESLRTKLSVTINPLPVSPTVRDTVFCQNSTSIILSAVASSGNSLLWYGANATGGTSSVNAAVPITTSTGSFTYYVSQKNTTTGCESSRSKIGVTINPLPLAPIVRDTSYCNNTDADTLRFNALSGTSILWYGTNATGGIGTSIATKPSTATVGATSYYLSQIITGTGCEGPRSKVIVTTKPLPNAPTISRDTANYLVSGTSATTWYKDGVALTDTTQKYKPTAPGSYTAKTTQNGCVSALSAPYYYLLTDIINLSKDEYIKLAPNPFINQLNFDFVVKGYQRLNIEVFDIATGTKVASQPNLNAGSRITLGQLSGGTYIIRVTSNDNKIVQQFKMVKL